VKYNTIRYDTVD